MNIPKRILLIEDEDLIRDLYKRQLEKVGLTTDAFATGQEGLTALDRDSYDLILLDIMLPKVNGLDILMQLKRNEKTKNIPVILVSNLGQDDVVQEGLNLGATSYLVKLHHTPDQIVEEVKKVLGE